MDVKRYSIFMHRRGGNKSVDMVEAEHFDAALAREAALREERAELEDEFDTLEHSNISLKLTLQAAEQRNAALETAIRHTLDDSSEDAQTGEITIMQLDYETLATLIDEPTESGASDEHPLRP